VQIRQAHTMTAAEARSRLSNLSQTNSKDVQRFSIALRWTSPKTAEISATSFKGVLRVQERWVTVDGKLGLLARPFAGRIQTAIANLLRDSLYDGRTIR